MRGNCYVAAEALYHLLGGKKSGWTPHSSRTSTDVHWYLVHESGLIVDPTRSQFVAHDLPGIYERGRGRGFLTRRPSARAKRLMRIILWQAGGA